MSDNSENFLPVDERKWGDISAYVVMSKELLWNAKSRNGL